MAKIDYKYNEDEAIKELASYIASTYNQHYSKNKFQATEFIIDGGHGDGFCMGIFSSMHRDTVTKTVTIEKT